MTGCRTEAVLLAALRATAPTERAERRADRANIVSWSWLGGCGERRESGGCGRRGGVEASDRTSFSHRLTKFVLGAKRLFKSCPIGHPEPVLPVRSTVLGQKFENCTAPRGNTATVAQCTLHNVADIGRVSFPFPFPQACLAKHDTSVFVSLSICFIAHCSTVVRRLTLLPLCVVASRRDKLPGLVSCPAPCLQHHVKV
jgi:hypothetical protein